MAGAAPAAAAAATASEHTRGTLVWVRPAAAAAAAGKTTAANASADAEEWVKATVSRVLDGGATLEVALEGGSSSNNEEEEATTTISVPAADAPLQNPASRLGVEVGKREREEEAMESSDKRREGEEAKRKQGAPFFSTRKAGEALGCFFALFAPVGGARRSMREPLAD